MTRSQAIVALFVLSLGCSKKDIGESCSKPDECEFDLCLSDSTAHSSRRVCSKTCNSDAECPNEGMCVGTRCIATCASQDDCPEETLCQDGLCAITCRTQNDCENATCPAAGQVCEQ